MANYEYREITPADEDEIIQLYYEYWRTETLAQALGMEVPRECQKFVEYAMAQCLHNEVSVVAVDTQTGKLVGMNVCVIGTPSNTQNWNYPDDDPNCKTMLREFQVMNLLTGTESFFKLFNVTQALLSRGLVVYPAYQCQGIGFKLCEMSLERARKLGIPVAIVECTSIYSKKIMDQLGFKNVNEVKLADFYDGNECFNLPSESPHQFITQHILQLIP